VDHDLAQRLAAVVGIGDRIGKRSPGLAVALLTDFTSVSPAVVGSPTVVTSCRVAVEFSAGEAPV
jgi:hypothetical protein